MLWTVLAVVGFVVLWIVWYLVADAVAEVIKAWFGRVTGLSAWARRVRWHERVLARTGAFMAAFFSALSATLTGLFGLAMTVAPPAPYDRGTGLLALVIAAVLGIAAMLLGIRWWRVSAFDLP